MVLSYKKKYLNGKITLSIGYIVIGSLSAIWGEGSFLVMFILIGILFGILYFYWKNKGYVKIDSKGITKYKFIPKTLLWEEFKGMRYYTDSIKLLKAKGEFDIDKQYLNDKDLKRLEQEIKSRLPHRKIY